MQKSYFETDVYPNAKTYMQAEEIMINECVQFKVAATIPTLNYGFPEECQSQEERVSR